MKDSNNRLKAFRGVDIYRDDMNLKLVTSSATAMKRSNFWRGHDDSIDFLDERMAKLKT